MPIDKASYQKLKSILKSIMENIVMRPGNFLMTMLQQRHTDIE